MALLRSRLCVLFFVVFLPRLHSLGGFSPSRTLSHSFPLTTRHVPRSPAEGRDRLFATQTTSGQPPKIAAKYSMVLVVSLPVGTPAQAQNLLLDTGSQLSWVPCGSQIKPSQAGSSQPSASMASFNPTVSTSFSPLSCKDPMCKPPVPDFSIPTVCDQKQLCQYSYFYADGTLAEGNLVKEKVAVSTPVTTSPIVLGCSGGSKDDNGILGMNMGRLSFVSQSRIKKFSYCVPAHTSRTSPSPTGAFYIGDNPYTAGIKYVNFIKYSELQRMPNLDPHAYTVPMKGIRIGRFTLNISESAFRPDDGGSGQTFIDSGSELTYLVDEAYDKVRETVVRLAGRYMKKDFSYSGVADMCFDVGVAPLAAQRLGGVRLGFDRGVEIAISQEFVLADVGDGVKCLPFGRGSMIGSTANIIGNVQQQNLWVEYDLAGGRIGFGKADCSKSYTA